MLFDISRQILDSRFLKRDEYISPSESLSFGGHLVNVGEPNNICPIFESVTQKTETEVPCETRSISGHQDFVKASVTLVSWYVYKLHALLLGCTYLLVKKIIAAEIAHCFDGMNRFATRMSPA